jgi:DNA-binding NarL/FixJ family response regulator
MSSLRLVLVDDHALVRAGLRALLGEMPGVSVVAEAGDGREALQLIREHKPDIALLDISLPELNGLEVAARVAKEHPATRVIILSMHGDDESVGARSPPEQRGTCSRTRTAASSSWPCAPWRAAMRG